MAKTIADGYIELRVDDSKLEAETKAKAAKVTRDFGSRLNTQLRALNLDAIDLKADPASARATIKDTERRLRDLSRDAGTLDLKIKSEQALAGIGRLRKQIGDLDDEPVTVEAETSPAQREIERVGRQLSALGVAPIPINSDPTEALQEIDRVQRQLRELSENATTAHVRIDADAARSDLDRLKKRIGDAGDDSADGFAAKLGAQLGPLLEKLPIAGPLGIGMAAAGVAAAPMLASVIAGAVIGEAGIGGVVGGLALAAKDTRVKAMADNLGDRLEDRLEQAAGTFVVPALGGLKQIQQALDTIDFEGIFSRSAEFVQPLTAGATSAITDIGDALEKLVSSAGPVIDVISDGIAQIGSTLGTGLSNLADNGPEAAAALTTLFEVVSSGIGTTLTLVNVLTELYGIGQKIGADYALQTLLKVTGAEMDKTASSSQRAADGASDMSLKMIEAEASAEELKERQEQLKKVQDALKISQDGLQRTLDSLGGKTTFAARASDALRTAMDNLHGAAIRNTDANEGYQASWDSLTDSVKTNKRTLDIHTAAGRANRDALQDLLTKNNELYLANINAGVSIDSARKKHQDRTAAIEKEARKLGLDRDETQKLISTYGKIPPRKTTDLILSGISSVADALLDLAAVQLHLAKGTPLSGDLARRLARAQYGMPDTKRAHGGPLPGSAPHDRADNELYWGTPGEWVIQRPTVRKVEMEHGSGAMAYFNRYGELPVPGYASGSLIKASKVAWPPTLLFDTNVSGTKVPTIEQAIAAVPFGFGQWPSSPSAQRGDSGVWRRILSITRAAGFDAPLVSGYRPGDPKWHGSGRADDFGGFNQDALARFWAARRPLELIHRSATRDYAYTRGVDKGSFNDALMEAHRNHVHVAMAHGGSIGRRMGLPLFDSGGTLMPGINTVYNGLGRPEPLVPAGASNTYNINVTAPVGSHPAEIGREVVEAIQAYESSNGSRWRQT